MSAKIHAIKILLTDMNIEELEAFKSIAWEMIDKRKREKLDEINKILEQK